MLGEPHSRDGRSEKEKNFCPYRDLNPVPSRLWQVAVPTTLLGFFQIRNSETRHIRTAHEYEELKTVCAQVQLPLLPTYLA